MTKQKQELSERMVEGYNAMLTRAAETLHNGEQGVKQALDKAMQKSSELGELSREEAERVGDYLKRDVTDAGNDAEKVTTSLQRNSGAQDRDWAAKFFDPYRAVLERVPEARVRSDDHRAYPPALRRLACRCIHEVTSSKERRTARNPLFEINLVDGLIRHSQANHRRETWAYSKRRQGSSDRLAIFAVWRNYLKLRWEKRCQKTPAMLKGLLERRWTVEDVLKERLFRTRIALSERWASYYDREVVTPALGRNRPHELKYAY